MTSGYYCMARGWMERPRFRPRGAYSNAKAWLWMIEAAAFRAHEVTVTNGRAMATIRLERGELSHSYRFLARKWGWSIKRVQTFFAGLAKEHAIAIRTDTLQTVISLCNYDRYQFAPAAAETRTETQSPTRIDTKKKERRESKQSDGRFDAWYALYPRKIARADAARAFDKLIASGAITHDELCARTRAFAERENARPEPERRFTPYPASWLNKGHWDNPDLAPARMVPQPVTRPAAALSRADWQAVMMEFRRDGLWTGAWGPAPGEPGCLVPSDLA